MTKALITGGCGFIGRHLARELMKNGIDIHILDNKNDTELMEELGCELTIMDIMDVDYDIILPDIDIVFHLAGLLGTSELFDRIELAEIINVEGTLRLLEGMRKNGVPKIVYMSKPNIWKHNPYTITKENCERWLEMYREVYGIDVVIVCPYNVYGPEEHLEEYRKAVPYFIIAALNNDVIEIWGSGESTMDLIYVEDSAKVLHAIGTYKEAITEIVEIGTGMETSVNDLASKIKKMIGSNSPIINRPMRMGEIDKTSLHANTEIMDYIFNSVPKDLEDGLNETIKHYRNNLDKYTVIQI